MFRSVIALVFLSSVTVAGGAGVAHAQEQAYRIPIADLDLSSGKGMAEFNRRVDVGARQLCESRNISGGIIPNRDYRECLQAVREEANENLRIALRKNATQMAVGTPRR